MECSCEDSMYANIYIYICVQCEYLIGIGANSDTNDTKERQKITMYSISIITTAVCEFVNSLKICSKCCCIYILVFYVCTIKQCNLQQQKKMMTERNVTLFLNLDISWPILCIPKILTL